MPGLEFLNDPLGFGLPAISGQYMEHPYERQEDAAREVRWLLTARPSEIASKQPGDPTDEAARDFLRLAVLLEDRT